MTADPTELYGGLMDGAFLPLDEGESEVEVPWRGPGRVMMRVRYTLDDHLTQERQRPVFSYVSQRRAGPPA